MPIFACCSLPSVAATVLRAAACKGAHGQHRHRLVCTLQRRPDLPMVVLPCISRWHWPSFPIHPQVADINAGVEKLGFNKIGGAILLVSWVVILVVCIVLVRRGFWLTLLLAPVCTLLTE